MKNLKYFIEQTMTESFWVSFFTLMLLISPGILIIFYYFPELFLSIDVIKLLIFVLSIMVPLVTINSFLFGIIVIKDDYVIKSIVLIFITSLIIYFGLFLSYLFF